MELHGDRRDQVEIGQTPAGVLSALAQGPQEHLGGFGNEGVAQPAVGQLTGEP